MRLFLFRNSVNPIDYCATDTRSGHKLPPLRRSARWQYHTELQNCVHAAVFGVMNFEAVKNTIAMQGYVRFTELRILRDITSLESLERAS